MSCQKTMIQEAYIKFIISKCSHSKYFQIHIIALSVKKNDLYEIFNQGTMLNELYLACCSQLLSIVECI